MSTALTGDTPIRLFFVKAFLFVNSQRNTSLIVGGSPPGKGVGIDDSRHGEGLQQGRQAEEKAAAERQGAEQHRGMYCST